MNRKIILLSDKHVEYLENESENLKISVSDLIKKILEKHIKEEKK